MRALMNSLAAAISALARVRVVDGQERAARHAVDAGQRHGGVVVVPTVVLDRDQARMPARAATRRRPSSRGRPGRLDRCARAPRAKRSRTRSGADRVARRAALGDEVEQAVVEAALRAMGGMIEVIEIEAASRHRRSVRRSDRDRDRRGRAAGRRPSAAARCAGRGRRSGADRRQTRRVVAGVVVAGNVDGVIGENGNAHGHRRIRADSIGSGRASAKGRQPGSRMRRAGATK